MDEFYNSVHNIFLSTYDDRISDINYHIENNKNVKVKYLFNIISNNKTKKFTVSKKNYDDIDINKESGIYYSILKDFNYNLPDFLEKHKIKFFVPKGSPSYKIKNNTIKIYYFHDNDGYKLMDTEDYPNIINAPDGYYRKQLEDLYAVHHDILPPFKSKYYKYRE